MRRIAVLLLSSVLAACAVGPRYHVPPTPAGGEGAFQSAGDPAKAAAAPLPAHWWRLYQDPVLDGLVQQALTENQDLKVAAANLAYAQGLLDEARAGQFPSTTVTAGGPSYSRGTIRTGSGFGSGASESFAAGFTASYQVDLFGRIRRTIQAAKASAESAQATEDATRVTVAAETAKSYADLCGYGEQIDVAKRSVGLVQQTYDLTVVERDAGAMSDFDVSREAALLAQAKAALNPLEGQRRVALFTLAALVGKTPANAPAQAAACHVPPRLNQPLPVGDGAALLRRRPDLRAAERSLAAATARIGLATADFYPTITIGGAINNAASSLGGLGSLATATYSGGPLLTWSLPNILVARAHVKETSAQASAALAGFDGTVLNALGDTEKALSTYGAELDHHVALADAQKNADAALNLANIQFKDGAASVLDLITAEQTAVAADQAVAASDQALSDDQVAVFQALGGGWEDASAVTGPKLTAR